MIEVFTKNILAKWMAWYLKDGPKAILHVWSNFLKFNAHFFSILFLLKTLFAPWKKISQPYVEGLANLDKNFSIFLLNMFSRIFGAIVRLITILVGVIVQATILVAGFLFFIIWFLLPAIILFGLVFSFLLIF